MPKLKTKRSAVKRFRSTGTGKIKVAKAFRRHNLSLSKNRKRKRHPAVRVAEVGEVSTCASREDSKPAVAATAS